MLNSEFEARLYAKEPIELPDWIRNRFSRRAHVYQPDTSRDLKHIFSLSQKKNLPLIPRGAATSGIGGILPLRRSLLVDLTRLNRIIDIDQKKKIIHVEGGARWWELKRVLNRYGFDLFTSPTSLFSTVGGWLSTGGYGLNSYRYGHVSNLVESIEVSTAEGPKVVERDNQRFRYFIGSEGQMGIISKVMLRVREKTPSRPHLVFFETIFQAWEFLRSISKSPRLRPSHLSILDRNRLKHLNLLLNGNVSFPPLEGVLVAFEEKEPEDIFWNLVTEKKGELAEDYLTGFLWNEKYFPFSLRRFYLSILGSEVILPLENLPSYIERLRQFSEDFNLHLAAESTLINEREAVVFTLFPSDPKRFVFLLHLPLTYVLARIAMDFGGKPYGIGTWNLPFLKEKFSKDEIEDYRRFKSQLDPQSILNPGKSFSRDGWMSFFLKAAYSLISLYEKLGFCLKFLLKEMSSNHKEIEEPLPETEACANCGACTIVCPAYLVEQNEVVTAKGKLLLLKRLQKGEPLPKTLAEKSFLCSHCHLCEEVCQSKLRLVPLWEKLEAMIKARYGYPKDKVEKFIERIESSPEYARLLDELHLSPHSLRESQNV